jgi:hypothetical protein
VLVGSDIRYQCTLTVQLKHIEFFRCWRLRIFSLTRLGGSLISDRRSGENKCNIFLRKPIKNYSCVKIIAKRIIKSPVGVGIIVKKVPVFRFMFKKQVSYVLKTNIWHVVAYVSSKVFFSIILEVLLGG